MTVPDAAAWSHLPGNLARIQERIAAAARRAGRDPARITLVAASKTVPPEGVVAAAAAGLRVFGENRIQEAQPKMAALASLTARAGLRWHFIGHLQTNKAKAATAFDMIESVDSLHLAEALAQRLTAPLPILLEVNMTGETSKAGLPPDAVVATVEAIRALPHLRVEGLMTMAPESADPETARPVFRALRELGDRVGLTTLSMGMTNDFEVAVEEGATLVRIGRAIFGAR